jgi:hypothetical protein
VGCFGILLRERGDGRRHHAPLRLSRMRQRGEAAGDQPLIYNAKQARRPPASKVEGFKKPMRLVAQSARSAAATSRTAPVASAAYTVSASRSRASAEVLAVEA